MEEHLRVERIIVTLLFLSLLCPSTALVNHLPGLYLDKFSMGSINGAEHGPSSGGSNYSLAWRQALPGVVSSGLSLYNFQTSHYSILSYRTQLLSMSNSSGIVNVDMVGTTAKILYLAFSVVILTENNNYLEMLTLESNPISELSSNQMVLSASYTKFNNSQPIVHRFYEWVTGNSYLGSY